MVTRTFLDKTNTIKLGSEENYGLHPISIIGYGQGVYRSLIHFNVSKLRELVEDSTYPDMSLLKHRLKMRNCGNVDRHAFFAKSPSSVFPGVKERATSFDVILFKINKHWDEGIGFDSANDFWITGNGCVSYNGSTWYNSTTDTMWDEDGIYSNEFIEGEYEKYLQIKNNSDSGTTNTTIIVGSQHFDHGNENLDIDITEYVNSLIDGEENYGLCLAFVPSLENREMDMTQYAGFFNEKTNTIFEPVVETRYDCKISDDRMDFYLGKENKLYLYSYIGGKLENLDKLPSCTVNDEPSLVEQESKGVYSTKVKLPTRGYIKDSVLYDVWSNLVYDGDEIDDVELEFVTKSDKNFFSISNELPKPTILNPLVSGINYDEKLNKGEERVVRLYFREPYTDKDYRLVDNCQYRIYVMDGEREITIVDWDEINRMDKYNSFTIKTDEFVPAKYRIDIRAQFGDNVKIYKNELHYEIVSDASEMRL